MRAAAEGEGGRPGRQAVDRTVQSSLSASDMIEKVPQGVHGLVVVGLCVCVDRGGGGVKGGGLEEINLALPGGTSDAEP